MDVGNFVIYLDSNGNPIPGVTNANFCTTSTGQTATASVASNTQAHHVVTDILCCTDADDTVVSLKQGTTVLMSFTIDKAGTFHHSFGTPVVMSTSKSAIVTLQGTTTAYANMTGYSIAIK
jgi:hypothetical protein